MEETFTHHLRLLNCKEEEAKVPGGPMTCTTSQGEFTEKASPEPRPFNSRLEKETGKRNNYRERKESRDGLSLPPPAGCGKQPTAAHCIFNLNLCLPWQGQSTICFM